MSQDQPKQPEPKKPTPPTPTPKSQTGSAQTGFQKAIATLDQTWKRVQPALKTQTAKVLRGTLRVLQGTAEKQKAKPTPTVQPPADTLPSAATSPPETAAPPSITVIEIPQATTQPAATAEPTSEVVPAAKETPKVTTTPPAATAQPTPKVVKTVQKPSNWEKLRVILANLPIWWKAALAKIRTRLPESVNRKLPNDTLLTGAIAALFILLFWATSILSPGKPPEVAKIPPAPPTPPPELTVPPEVATAPEVIPSPELTVPPEVAAAPEETPVAEVTPPQEVKVPENPAPPELTAPKPPQLVEISAPPAPVLTPEENLIASIQNQVGEIAGGYADGLIRSIQANFPASLLTVKVADDWYNFDPEKQDNLATDMWRRAQEFDFSKIEITDTQGRLLARNPVVGSNMVIVKRQLLATN